MGSWMALVGIMGLWGFAFVHNKDGWLMGHGGSSR